MMVLLPARRRLKTACKNPRLVPTASDCLKKSWCQFEKHRSYSDTLIFTTVRRSLRMLRQPSCLFPKHWSIKTWVNQSEMYQDLEKPSSDVFWLHSSYSRWKKDMKLFPGLKVTGIGKMYSFFYRKYTPPQGFFNHLDEQYFSSIFGPHRFSDFLPNCRPTFFLSYILIALTL